MLLLSHVTVYRRSLFWDNRMSQVTNSFIFISTDMRPWSTHCLEVLRGSYNESLNYRVFASDKRLSLIHVSNINYLVPKKKDYKIIPSMEKVETYSTSTHLLLTLLEIML